MLRRRREARIVCAEPDGHEPDARRLRHRHLGDDLKGREGAGQLEAGQRRVERGRTCSRIGSALFSGRSGQPVRNMLRARMRDSPLGVIAWQEGELCAGQCASSLTGGGRCGETTDLQSHGRQCRACLAGEARSATKTKSMYLRDAHGSKHLAAVSECKGQRVRSVSRTTRGRLHATTGSQASR